MKSWSQRTGKQMRNNVNPLISGHNDDDDIAGGIPSRNRPVSGNLKGLVKRKRFVNLLQAD